MSFNWNALATDLSGLGNNILQDVNANNNLLTLPGYGTVNANTAMQIEQAQMQQQQSNTTSTLVWVAVLAGIGIAFFMVFHK